MISIAICDDEEEICNLYYKKISILLSELEWNAEIQVFQKEMEFLEKLFLETFDLIFLDIDMPKISGLEIAGTIRKLENKPILIFITNQNELVYETFQYQPFRFIRKSYFDEEIREALESALLKITEKNNVYVIKNGTEIIKIKIADILYFESDRNYIYLYMEGKTYHFRGTLSAVEKELVGKQFIRIHKGFLVNQEAVFQIGADSLKLKDGSCLPIGRAKKEFVKKKLMRYFMQ